MATDSSTKQYIIQQIAANLNINDVTPQSKLHQMVEGFINELDNFEDYSSTTLSNMFIETCSIAFLEKAGAQEGLSRKKLPIFKFSEESSIVSIERYSTEPSLKTISRGTSVEITDNVWVTFLNDVDLSTISDNTSKPVAVSVEITASNVQTDSISFIKDSSFAISQDLPGFSVRIGTDLILPIEEETVEEYRARLLYSKFNSKHGSDSAVRLAVASSSLVSDYHVNYETTPVEISLFNTAMLGSTSYVEYINEYAVPVIEAALNQRKSAGTSFKLVTPAQVAFSLVFRPITADARQLPSQVFSFVDYITKTYKIGSEIIYDINSIKAFLESNSVSTDFLDDYKVIFRRNFLSFTYESDDNQVLIMEGEYPFLESITVGG